MKKSFLIKATIVYYLLCCFFLIWQINTAKGFCESRKACVRIQKQPDTTEINSYEVFPFDDFLIKV